MIYSVRYVFLHNSSQKKHLLYEARTLSNIHFVVIGFFPFPNLYKGGPMNEETC